MYIQLFNSMHRVYSSSGKTGMYIAIFNLEWLLDEDSKVDGDNDKEDTLHFINFWLNSIARNSPSAPVIIVGTHKDKVVRGDDLRKSNAKLAADNHDIKRAQEIIGGYIQNMQVYKSKCLKLKLPEQPSSCETVFIMPRCFRVNLHM